MQVDPGIEAYPVVPSISCVLLQDPDAYVTRKVSNKSSCPSKPYTTLGTPHEIKWVTTWGGIEDASEFNGFFHSEAIVEYSVDGGPWVSIASNVTHINSVVMWTPPATISSNVRVRVRDTLSGNAFIKDTVIGPEVAIMGPSLVKNGKSGMWSAGVNPNGLYQYEWYRAPEPGTAWSFVGSGASYSGAPAGSGFQLRVDVYASGMIMGSARFSISCSDCPPYPLF